MTALESYCIDTSSLLEAWGRSYRPQTFRAFWRRLEQMIAERRGVICEEVRTEIEDDSNKLIDWVKQQHDFVVQFDRQQELIVKQVMCQFPGVVNLKKNKGWADPFVIALAKVGGHVVVTEEGRGAQNGPKIPYICLSYGVHCMNLADMIDNERWTFD